MLKRCEKHGASSLMSFGDYIEPIWRILKKKKAVQAWKISEI